MNEPVKRFGIYLYALATIAAGVLDLIWGEFEAAHQPIGALGDHIPGQTIFAYITAVWMIGAGLAILWRRTTRWGALAAAAVYLVFALFWLPRFVTVPKILGFSFTLFFGLLAGMFTQLVTVAGGLLIYSSRTQLFARFILGLGSLLFGFAHLAGVQDVSRMMPVWMPLGGPFWVVLTGVAFLLAGLSILSGVMDRIAAHLLALMLLLFEISLITLVVGNPHNHIPWGSNAYSLAAAGAVMIYAGLVSRRQVSS
jgi:uncharacterized membrane protein YphA (DoxX/SURF4 family)